jgi:hypothetical protein
LASDGFLKWPSGCSTVCNARIESERLRKRGEGRAMGLFKRPTKISIASNRHKRSMTGSDRRFGKDGYHRKRSVVTLFSHSKNWRISTLNVTWSPGV